LLSESTFLSNLSLRYITFASKKFDLVIIEAHEEDKLKIKARLGYFFIYITILCPQYWLHIVG
jgi:hypothetical protein